MSKKHYLHIAMGLLFFSFLIPNAKAAIDIELDMSVDNPVLEQYQFRTMTLIVSNNGDETATGVTVDLDFPSENFFTTFFSPTTISQGGFAANVAIWEVGSLEPGASAIFKTTFQILDPNRAFEMFSQVIEADQDDIDSTPNNNDSGKPTEDDEGYAQITNDDITTPVGGGNNDDDDDDTNDDDDDDTTNGGDGTGGDDNSNACENDETPRVFLRAPVELVTGVFKVEIYFNEVVTGLEIEDFELENCEIIGLYGEYGGQYYSLDVRPLPGDVVSIMVASNSVMDCEENTNTESNMLFVEFDYLNSYVDLELDMDVDKFVLGLYENITYTLNITNKGTIPATNTKIDFGYDAPNSTSLAFVYQNVPMSVYDSWNGEWKVDWLAPGETKTLIVTLFTLEYTDVILRTEVTDCYQYDHDSSYGNAKDLLEEDDEDVTYVTVTSGGTSLQIENEMPEMVNEISPITNADATTSSIDVTAYPNPFVDHININLETEFTSDYQIQLYNVSGQLIKSYDWETTKGFNTRRIEMSNLQNGMYLISIKNGLEVIDTQTIMKF